MKNLVLLALVSIVTIASSNASAWDGKEKYLVQQEGGVQYVLFPENLATGILNALKSGAMDDQKAALINAQIFLELAKIDASPTFCTVAGPVYQTANRNEQETVAKCEELLQKPSFAKSLIKGPPDDLATITPREFSEQISKFFAIMIQM